MFERMQRKRECVSSTKNGKSEQALRPLGFLKRTFIMPYPASSKYVASADFLRVVCVWVIAWFHIWQQSWLNPVLKVGAFRIDFNPVVRSGAVMVDLLLMLSGFLLFLPYARSMVEKAPLPKVGEYYLKRATRILPSYWGCLFIILFFFALPKDEYCTAGEMWLDLLSHLTFTHTFFTQSYLNTRLNGVLWTLAVEVQFYLIAPLVCRAFVRKPAVTYCVMVCAAFLWRFVYVLPKPDTSMYFNQLPAMLDVYANGMLGALAYVWLCRYMKRRGWKAFLMSAGSVACMVGIWHLMDGQSRVSGGYEMIRAGQMLRRFPLSALGALLLVCAGHGLNGLTRLISTRPVRWLSLISYNFYIWHAYGALRLKEWHIPPYLSELPNQAGEQPWQTQYTLLCFAFALLLAALATYLIERPAQAAARRLRARK